MVHSGNLTVKDCFINNSPSAEIDYLEYQYKNVTNDIGSMSYDKDMVYVYQTIKFAQKHIRMWYVIARLGYVMAGLLIHQAHVILLKENCYKHKQSTQSKPTNWYDFMGSNRSIYNKSKFTI